MGCFLSTTREVLRTGVRSLSLIEFLDDSILTEALSSFCFFEFCSFLNLLLDLDFFFFLPSFAD